MRTLKLILATVIFVMAVFAPTAAFAANTTDADCVPGGLRAESVCMTDDGIETITRTTEGLREGAEDFVKKILIGAGVLAIAVPGGLALARWATAK